MRIHTRAACIFSFGLILSNFAHAGARGVNGAIPLDQSLGDTDGLATVGPGDLSLATSPIRDSAAETELLEDRLVRQKIPTSPALQVMKTETGRLRNPGTAPTQLQTSLESQLSNQAKDPAIEGYRDLSAKLYAENQALIKLKQDQAGLKVEIGYIEQAIRRGAPEEQHLKDVQRELGGQPALIAKQEQTVRDIQTKLADLMETQPQTIGKYLALKQTVYDRNLAKQAQVVSGAARVVRGGCPLEESAADDSRKILGIKFEEPTTFSLTPTVGETDSLLANGALATEGRSIGSVVVRHISLLPVCVAAFTTVHLLTHNATAAEKEGGSLDSVSNIFDDPSDTLPSGGSSSAKTGPTQ